MNLKGLETLYSRKSYDERLIGAGRAVLAGFFLLAIWLDPSEPSRYAHLTYTILAGYLVYALALALVIWRLVTPGRVLPIFTHVVDLMVFTVIMFFTEGPTSPFFVYFIFSLVCATLRWQWRGTLWTALVSLVVVGFLALYSADLWHDPQYELNRVIIRLVYLSVTAILLGYLGAHELKRRQDLSRLASWPTAVPTGLRVLLRETMEHAAGILGAPRLVLALEEPEEAGLHLARWSDREFDYRREPPDVFGALVAEPLAGTSFFCPNLRVLQPLVICHSPAGWQRKQGAPLHSQLQERFNPEVVLALKLSLKNREGYLLALDKRQTASDDLLLGEIVVHEVAARLNTFFLLEELQQGAAAEERVRLARDLHDGLLQSLTGAALQLETVRRLLETDPHTAETRLREIQNLIAAEQRDLRAHIQDLKPTPPGLTTGFGLPERLEGLRDRLKRHWGLTVAVGFQHPGPTLPRALAQEIYWIVHESLINTARHARASAAQAKIAVGDHRVSIRVEDDGRGFPFQGRYTLDQLAESHLGPAVLMERIGSLGGSLTLDSGNLGSRMEIILPFREGEN